MKKNWIVSIILVTIFFATTILIILIYNAKFVSSHKILLSFIEFYDNDFPQSRELDSTLKVGIVDGGIATSTDELSNITLIQKKFVFNSTLVDSEHATAIAGIIAATKNKKGIKGIVSNVEIINTVVTENGKATQDNISKGIMYCATNGANVINVSIEVDVFESILLEAIRYAAERDIIVNFANGNGGWRVNLKK